MSLANKITKFRKEKGLGIDELAELSGVPKGTLAKISAGLTLNPTLETVRAIAYALGRTLDDFIDTADTEKTAQGEMTLNGFDHALLDMTKEYSQEQKAQFLENAKIFDNSLKWKEQQGGE